MYLEQREHSSRVWLVISPAVAVIGALAATSILILWAGAPLGRALAAMLDGAFGSKFAVFETLAAATPLIFTGLAIAVAFSAKLYNIGGEGQFYAGAIVATFIGTGAVEGWPPIVVIGLMIIAGALAGGALLLGPAFLKVN